MVYNEVFCNGFEGVEEIVVVVLKEFLEIWEFLYVCNCEFKENFRVVREKEF